MKCLIANTESERERVYGLRFRWRDSPARHDFGDHPALRGIAGKSFVEATRLCFGEHGRRAAFCGLTGYMAALAGGEF